MRPRCKVYVTIEPEALDQKIDSLMDWFQQLLLRNFLKTHHGTGIRPQYTDHCTFVKPDEPLHADACLVLMPCCFLASPTRLR